MPQREKIISFYQIDYDQRKQLRISLSQTNQQVTKSNSASLRGEATLTRVRFDLLLSNCT